jgi:hypothetical protein
MTAAQRISSQTILKRLVAALSVSQLAGNGRKDLTDLFAQANQNRDSYHGDKCQDQGIFHKSLAPFVFVTLVGTQFMKQGCDEFHFILIQGRHLFTINFS